MVLEVMADAARIAHAARRDHDVKTRKAGERLALVDAFGRLHIGRVEGAGEGIAVIELL